MSKKVSITGFFDPLLIGILSSLRGESFTRLKKVTRFVNNFREHPFSHILREINLHK